MSIACYATMAAKNPLQPFSYEPGPLSADEVEVKISHCGICHSDVHLVDNDWGNSIYPLVPGHEIVGYITAIGGGVSGLQIGQRVGLGWQGGSCNDCECCRRGEENLCPGMVDVANGHYGGFAERVRCNYKFAFPIPDALASENAAPLLCGGTTVYSPLRQYVRPYMKVGVIGIGGLGHMALQFARAFGCEVTAFSNSTDKEQEAKKFGAHHFIATQDPKSLLAAKNSLDFILSTVPVDLNWEGYLNVLRPHGKLCVVGVAKTITVPVFSLLLQEKTICASLIGSPLLISEMLEFAARHQVQAQTQVMPMQQVNEALQHVRDNQARYRVVLTN